MQNVLWPEDIKCPIVVGLAGKDRIVPSKPLRRYLLSHSSFATTPSNPSSGNSTSIGKDDGSPDGNLIAAGGVVVGGSGGGGGDGGSNSMLTGASKFHTLNVASHSRAPSFGAAFPFATGASGVAVDGKGGRHTPVSASMAETVWGSGEEDSEKGGGVAAKRVELVYWAEAGHGHVLGKPKALDDFVRVATRQEEALFS